MQILYPFQPDILMYNHSQIFLQQKQKNMKFNSFIFMCVLLLAACYSSVEQKEVKLDFETQVRLESVEDYLQIDSLVRVSMADAFIAKFDKMIPAGDVIYVMDGMQGMVFKIDMKSKSVRKFLDKVGAAKNEYICITDIAMDKQGNLLVYDSESEKINVYDSSARYIRTLKVNCGTSLAVSSQGKIGVNTGQMEESQIYVYSPDGVEECQIKQVATYPNFSFDNVRGIAPWKSGFVFTVPFDYHIYMVDGSAIIPVVDIDCGKKKCDVEHLKQLDIVACRNAIFKQEGEILYFDNLSVYNNYIFFSTDMNDQLLYDYDKNSLITLSNLESPYNVLFSNPLFVNDSGQFCNAITDSNIKNAYVPSIEVKGVKSSTLNVQHDGASDDAEYFWVLTGKVK